MPRPVRIGSGAGPRRQRRYGLGEFGVYATLASFSFLKLFGVLGILGGLSLMSLAVVYDAPQLFDVQENVEVGAVPFWICIVWFGVLLWVRAPHPGQAGATDSGVTKRPVNASESLMTTP